MSSTHSFGHFIWKIPANLQISQYRTQRWAHKFLKPTAIVFYASKKKNIKGALVSML